MNTLGNIRMAHILGTFDSRMAHCLKYNIPSTSLYNIGIIGEERQAPDNFILYRNYAHHEVKPIDEYRRYVSAKRAKKLRKRGEYVVFCNARFEYYWIPEW